ncbi:MAG: sporulation protein [Oscillospiraceae bacterium]|jgi:sporulation integral membrane protein YlbJ|nr:sporulation protein [Oscillospiraceae bacterium]MCI1991228.1 sporulation protein [Oscillospiraceae bacterium]MCI2035602.1 sporulation protein [Oscillospiraceae bacterium]
MKIKTGALLAAVLAAACALLIFPAQAAQGAKNGVGYSLNILVPSLYPFMALSVFVVKSGLAERIGSALEKPTRALFRLPGAAAASVLMSAVGGFPSGARSAAALYEAGIVTRAQAERMMCFCVNAGPSFVITAVGVGFLRNAQAGAVLFASQTASFLAMGILSGIFSGKGAEAPARRRKKPPAGTAQALIESAADAAYSTLMMCCLVILFAAMMNLLRMAAAAPGLSVFLSALLEVTGGCADLARYGAPLWAIAFAIGWSGVCVHMQVLSCLGGIPIRKARFALCRAAQGAVSAAVCFGLTALFPQSAETFGNFSGPVTGAFSNSVPSAAALAVLCAALLFCMPHEKLEIEER